ncbi:MAG: hypothetical protein COA71_04615 [SAR86 cluster bacterium]|uniref:Uncharacterized protein n=1 Tax=SAR86 cluster bacterium TaxID=2030880 RepID=A0A2A5CFZ6_9GAMM|nr:MAG: hypothetical protein COA71_04615 [SAR86 cluster bacterium]
MKNFMFTCLLTAGVLINVSTVAQAQSIKEQIGEVIPGFDYSLSFRYRMEGVNQENSLSDATASTLRSRLTLRATPLAGWGLLVEVDNVTAVGSKRYDSLALNDYRGLYSVVADPTGTELNQASITFSPATGHSFSLGRQRINHANQRFVGGVGWRQNEQTYDAVTYKYTSGLLDVNYSYLDKVHRVFGGKTVSIQTTEFDTEGNVLLGTLKQGWGDVSAYVYALDIENAAALSSMTYGLSYSGTIKGFAINAALAQQSDYANNPINYDTEFLSFSAAKSFGPVRALVGYELLGSDNNVAAFKTPLATLHAFQGWADVFLNTPAAGIEDAYLTLSGTLQGITLISTYHDFSAEEGGISYGSEIDIQASYTFNSTVSGAVKFASYSSDGFAVDTEKVWLTVSFSF